MPRHCQYGYVMTGPVSAEPDERAGWIRSGWDRAIPTRFYASTVIDGFDVALAVLVGDRGPGAIQVTVEQPKGGHGPAVTLSMLRKVTVDQIIRDALARLARPASSAEAETGIPGTFRVQGDDRIFGGHGTPEPGRGRDTSAERLADVARVYQAAVAAGRAPVKAVEKDLKYSRSTAGRLVGQARKAGLLAPTTQGKTSEAPAGAAAAAAAAARPEPGPSIFRDPSSPWPGEQGE
jgi:Family of unknown function (DUF6214)